MILVKVSKVVWRWKAKDNCLSMKLEQLYCLNLLFPVWWKFLPGPACDKRGSRAAAAAAEIGQKEALRIFKWHVCCTIECLLFWTSILHKSLKSGTHEAVWPTFQVIVRLLLKFPASSVVQSSPWWRFQWLSGQKQRDSLTLPTHRAQIFWNGAEIIGADRQCKFKAVLANSNEYNSLPFYPGQTKRI